jgi:magnesium chelatase family protein
MEERVITISRARFSIEYPANFMLVAAMNPCPCGYYNHPQQECACSAGTVQKYLNKISGPLMDRIDLHVEVIPVPFRELSAFSRPESSQDIRQRVIRARKIQETRFKTSSGIHCNAQIPSRKLNSICHIGEEGQVLLKNAMDRINLSARAYSRILKVSRTIADLDGSEQIQTEHLAEAIQYRSLDRENWGS